MVSSISRFGSHLPAATRPAAQNPPASVRFGGVGLHKMADYFRLDSPVRPQQITVIERELSQELNPGMTAQQILSTPGVAFKGTIEVDGVPYSLVVKTVNTQSGGGIGSSFVLTPVQETGEKLQILDFLGGNPICSYTLAGGNKGDGLRRRVPTALNFRDTLLTALVAALPKEAAAPPKKGFLKRLFGS